MPRSTKHETQALLPRVVHTRRAWWDHSWCRFLLAMGIVAILHIPLWVLSPDAIGTNGKGGRPRPPRLVLLPTPVRSHASPAPDGRAVAKSMPLREFYEWLALVNPARFYYPDDTSGPSAYNQPEKRQPHLAPILPWQPQGIVPVAFIFAPLRLSVPPEPQSHAILASWRWNFPDDDRPARFPAAAITPPTPPPAVYWRHEHGARSLENPPELAPELLAQLDQPAIQAKLREGSGESLLEILFAAGSTVPRIVLRRSCGVPELDFAAAQALRKQLQERLHGQPPPGEAALRIVAAWRR